MSTDIQTHYRTCNICEAMCGLVIEHRDKEVLSIKGDEDDPFSKGHVCPKAVALQDYWADEDRLKTPIKKTREGWQDISWEQQPLQLGIRRPAPAPCCLELHVWGGDGDSGPRSTFVPSRQGIASPKALSPDGAGFRLTWSCRGVRYVAGAPSRTPGV